MQDCYIYPEPLYLLIIKLLPAEIQNNHKRVTIQPKFTAWSHISSVLPNNNPFNKEQTVSVSDTHQNQWEVQSKVNISTNLE